MNEKILITGGSGIIGKQIIPFFMGYGYDVLNYDLMVGLDIFNEEQLIESMHNVSIVIHLAGLSHPFLKNFSDDDYYKINFEGSKKVIDCSLKSGIRKFIFTSSGCVYGFWGGNCVPQKFPIDEKNYTPTIEQGNSAYGISKLMVEDYLKDISKKHKNFDVYCLRIEGPGSSGVRLEWINGLHDNEQKSTVFTCPSYHFFAEISRINLWQILRLCVEKKINSSNYSLFNCGNEYVHWSINVQEWVKANYPNVKNNTNGNEALYSIEKAKSILKYKPYPIDDCFPKRNNVENFYQKIFYTGKIGKP